MQKKYRKNTEKHTGKAYQTVKKNSKKKPFDANDPVSGLKIKKENKKESKKGLKK